MDNIEISHESKGRGGRYFIALDGSEAELTYQNAPNDVRIADHTFVPDELRGKGIAARLVAALVDDAREMSFKIRPTCSYVVTAFKRHPEWNDLRD